MRRESEGDREGGERYIWREIEKEGRVRKRKGRRGERYIGREIYWERDREGERVRTESEGDTEGGGRDILGGRE